MATLMGFVQVFCILPAYENNYSDFNCPFDVAR